MLLSMNEHTCGISLLIRLFLYAIIVASAVSLPHLEIGAPQRGILKSYQVRRGQKVISSSIPHPLNPVQ